MKITSVTANNRRHVFEIKTRRHAFVFPYSEAVPSPSPDDRIEEVFVDPELGREGFTYRLESAAEGSVHIDTVLEFSQDPAYLADMALYRLTVQARERFEDSPLSARQVASMLGTSLSQLYRLLDPTNYNKSLRQMIALLYYLGYNVDVEITERRPRAAS